MWCRCVLFIFGNTVNTNSSTGQGQVMRGFVTVVLAIMLQNTLWLSPWLEPYFVLCPASSMFLGRAFTMGVETDGCWNGVSPKAQHVRSFVLLLLLLLLVGLVGGDTVVTDCEGNMWIICSFIFGGLIIEWKRKKRERNKRLERTMKQNKTNLKKKNERMFMYVYVCLCTYVNVNK